VCLVGPYYAGITTLSYSVLTPKNTLTTQPAIT